MKVLDVRSWRSLRSAEIEPGKIHPLEFRCVESGEWLLEERQPDAPCRVSSDDVWRVAVNEYETTRS